MNLPPKQLPTPPERRNVLEYFSRAVKRDYWPKTFSKCNEKALLSLTLIVIALPMHAYFCYLARTGFPNISRAMMLIELFVAIPLAGLAAVFAIGAIGEREGLLWPAWTVLAIVAVCIVLYRAHIIP